ncbi:DUF559 domain-containing protein [Devosia salina]|uniref:DUF559 domain-containing protein n=1 Tax=Devosia salina TaxID=2860336 RepID=A0ABX8WGH8_9HYPH|nr:DUF559 domain-containing protein [Devosia salina]
MARNSLPRKLRQTPTLAEVRFWRLLYPIRQMGWHFRKQAPMGRYVVDFVCHPARLIVEIDGGRISLSRACGTMQSARPSWRAKATRFCASTTRRSPKGQKQSMTLS